jgi:diguanylate cyclase (GGDEF)-like protein/PAS domain S-box-containing protein
MKRTAPSNEAARLQALGQYNFLDTSKDEQFADLVRLASQICRARVAFIGVVDKDRVWFKSKIGFEPNEIPRAGSFCDRAILQKRLFIVADTRADKRFKSSPLVTGNPRARFYAGMPLITAEGYVLGTLSVIDIIPRQLDQEQKDALVALARQVMSLFESQSVRPNLPNFLSELTEELHARTSTQEIQRKCEARLKAIVDYNITGISFANLEGNFTEANDAFFRMVGYTRDDLLSGKLSWRGIIPQEHRHLVGDAVEQMQSSGACAPFETEYIRKDGSRAPVLFGAALLSGSQHEVVCFSLDLSEYKQAQAKANHLAYHDALTNLPNQALFKDRLGQALALARRYEQMLGVLLVSLDRFKTINDTLGYVTADQLVRQVAQRLVSCVRESDTVARLGNDEFAILLTQVSRTEDAAKIAQTIKDTLSVPFNFDNQEFFVTASIGISLCPDDGNEPVTLLKSAATAMNRARERDGNDYQFYASGRTSTALRQLVLENNLRPGLEREEFILHFQPQVDLKTFQVVGTEALVRWEHPGLGLLYPGEFIGLAEDSGLIVSIGEWVLRAACLQSKSWQDAGLDPVRMAVNLSARQFQHPKLVETIARILKDTALDPRFLELELTEGSVMKDPDEAIGRLHELKAMGLQISIDDFGTGYSSLNYLKRFPISRLKIDQSFVSEIHTDSDDAAIVTAIITLAHALKLTVIAEGVETNEQLEFLSLLNCDEVQGYLFGKPLSAEEFTELLMERSGLNSRPSYDTNPLPPLQIILNELSDKRTSLRGR